MAPSEPLSAAPAEAVQAGLSLPPAVDERPLPPAGALSPAPPVPRTGLPWQGYVAFLLVAILAFLLASFPARHSDLWKHLAAGRSFVPGAGPGGALAEDRTWLYDLACYAVYATTGGVGLMLAKALLIVAVALLLLRLSRGEGGWLLATACTAPGASGDEHAAPAPTGTGFLLLSALTLVLLSRSEQRTAERLPPLLPRWPLVLLFVVWVNTDAWFQLGLAIVALVWLGQALDEGAGASFTRSALLGRRAGTLVLLAAACLLNPAHIHAFTSLPNLGGALDSTSGQAALTSPFQRIAGDARAYFQMVQQRPAGLAYYPLLGLGLLSFAMNLRHLKWQLLLPWLALVLLTLVQVRTIPFFAVAAGPALALNLRAWWARRAPAGSTRGVPAGLQTLALLPIVLVVVCAWPGWLQGRPYEPRRWAVEPPPALQSAAAVVERWHAEGKLPAGTRGLHLSNDSANAFAWFCPEDQALVDPSLTAAIRAESGSSTADAPGAVRSARIDHVVVYDADPKTLELLSLNPVQWPLLYLEGNVAIVGWRDLAALDSPDPFRDRHLDLRRLALAPPRDQQAPRQGPVREPRVQPWWEALWRSAPGKSMAQEEADVYLNYAKVGERFAPVRRGIAWDWGQGAALVGAAGSWASGASPTPAAALLEAHVCLMRLQPRAAMTGAAPGQVALRREVVEWQRHLRSFRTMLRPRCSTWPCALPAAPWPPIPMTPTPTWSWARATFASAQHPGAGLGRPDAGPARAAPRPGQHRLEPGAGPQAQFRPRPSQPGPALPGDGLPRPGAGTSPDLRTPAGTVAGPLGE